MRHFTRCGALAVLAALAAASCSTAPQPPAVPVVLQPYAEAARFLLPGHSSLSFRRTDREPFEVRAAGAATRTMLVASCGSDFEKPKGVGSGRFRGVQAGDVGPGGVRQASELESEGFRAVAIDGGQAWHKREEVYDSHVSEIWLAQVDDRFVVWSPDRTDLERALARTGDLAELLRPFAAVRLLPDAAECVLCLSPRPGDPGWDPSYMLPVEPTVVCAPTPSRLVLFHRQPLPECVAGWPGDGTAPTTTSRSGFHVTEVAVDAELSEILLYALFGLKIFI